MLYIVGIVALIIIILLIINHFHHSGGKKNNTSGYNCIANQGNDLMCIKVSKDAKFKSKEDCNNSCNKSTETFKTNKENKKFYKCDESNCSCFETNEKSRGPIYSNHNDCQLRCNNCHNNLLNSYAIKPNLYYSALPNTQYMYSFPYQNCPFIENKYINYPYGYPSDPYDNPYDYPYGFEPPPLCNNR